MSATPKNDALSLSNTVPDHLFKVFILYTQLVTLYSSYNSILEIEQSNPHFWKKNSTIGKEYHTKVLELGGQKCHVDTRTILRV